jgi:hypothetical protein
MGETATKPKAPPKEQPAAAPVAAPVAEGAPAGMGDLMREIREQGQALLEQAREQAAAIVEGAREEHARLREEAEELRLRQEAALADNPKDRARLAVEHGRKEFDRLTSGDGRIWQAHEVQEDFVPVKFRAMGPKPEKSELRVLRVGRHEYTHMGRTEHSPGVAYQFLRGEFEALSQDVVDYLKSRPTFNVLFCEAGQEPGAAPDPGVMLEKVLNAVMELDDDALRELFDREQASHKRPVVLKAILHGRRQIRGQTGATQGDE